MSLQSDLTCFSEIKPVENVKPETDSGFDGISDLKIRSLEVQIAISVLRKAATEILNADSVNSQSKKLLCGLVEMAVEILEPVPEEKDRISEILAEKTRIVSCFFFLCVFATFAARLLLSSGSRSSYGKPPPT